MLHLFKCWQFSWVSIAEAWIFFHPISNETLRWAIWKKPDRLIFPVDKRNRCVWNVRTQINAEVSRILGEFKLETTIFIVKLINSIATVIVWWPGNGSFSATSWLQQFLTTFCSNLHRVLHSHDCRNQGLPTFQHCKFQSMDVLKKRSNFSDPSNSLWHLRSATVRKWMSQEKRTENEKLMKALLLF